MEIKRYVLVVPFWGETHFKLWLDYSLPSYFANNNLPFITRNANFSILICTDNITETLIEKSKELCEIKKLCNVEILNIQHVINNYTNAQYGYILTHCYHEGIKKFGRMAVNIHFIFLNADLLLANGMFKTIHKLINHGSEIIFCTAIRVIKEEFFVELKKEIKIVNNFKTISIEPRKLVMLAFKYLHPTVNAQMINNEDGKRSEITNQFYFKVNENVLLGNHFLIFPLVIKPSKIPKYPTGYIDYNIVYDFNPQGKIDYINDSDDAFMIEPEYKEKENEYQIFKSNIDENYYSNLLSKWVNKTHYQNANQRLIFHSKEINCEDITIKNKTVEFDQSMKKIINKLKNNRLLPYLQHPYWQDNSLSSKSFIKKNITLFVRKIITKFIEYSSKIKFDQSYFLMTKIKSTRFTMLSNLLRINQLYSVDYSQSNNYCVYIDIEHYTISQLMDIYFPSGMKIYLYAFDYDKSTYDQFIKQRASSIRLAKNLGQHKIFLSSIIAANTGHDLISKIKAIIKIIMIKQYLKIKNPYPNLTILEYTTDNGV